jgi:hypothetical protein
MSETFFVIIAKKKAKFFLSKYKTTHKHTHTHTHTLHFFVPINFTSPHFIDDTPISIKIWNLKSNVVGIVYGTVVDVWIST